MTPYYDARRVQSQVFFALMGLQLRTDRDARAVKDPRTILHSLIERGGENN